MEQQPEPVGNPPSYSEVAKNEPFKVHCGEDADGQMNRKESQYMWADPISITHCPPAESAQGPPPPLPAPYGPVYGQPMLAYYQQPGYGTPYYTVAPTQQHPQQVMMIGGQEHHQPVLIQHVQSFAAHIVLSCIVTFCCNFILGFIAFVLAGK